MSYTFSHYILYTLILKKTFEQSTPCAHEILHMYTVQLKGVTVYLSHYGQSKGVT